MQVRMSDNQPNRPTSEQKANQYQALLDVLNPVKRSDVDELRSQARSLKIIANISIVLAILCATATIILYILLFSIL